MTIWILLPAYNEAPSLPRLLPKIKACMESTSYTWRIVVCNDASSDETGRLLQEYMPEYPLDVITHPINRGLGETERDLFEYVAANGAPDDVAIRLDCDDTHDPQFFLSMAEKLGADYDVVTASRFQPGGGQSGVHGYRLLLTIAASFYMRILFPIQNIKDYSCGFRAYRVSILRDAVRLFGNNLLQMKGLGFVSTLETIVKLNLMGARFSEVPFMLHYDRKASPSKMLSSITSFGYLIMTVLHWWPFGGWRSYYKGLAAQYRENPELALEKYDAGSRKRPLFSLIGGGGK